MPCLVKMSLASSQLPIFHFKKAESLHARIIQSNIKYHLETKIEAFPTPAMGELSLTIMNIE